MRNALLLLFINFIPYLTLAQGAMSGTIKDATEDSIYPAIPLEGRYFLGYYPEVPLKKNGDFSLKIESTQPGFIYFPYGEKGVLFSNTFFYRPGMQTNVIIADNKVVEVSGDFTNENKLLATLKRPMHGTARKYISSLMQLGPERAFAAWKDSLDREIQSFKTYCEQHSCDSFFLEALITDHTYHYVNAFLSTIRGNSPLAFAQKMPNQWNEAEKKEIYNFWQKWEPLYEKVMATVSLDDQAFYAIEYVDFLNRKYVNWYSSTKKRLHQPEIFDGLNKNFYDYYFENPPQVDQITLQKEKPLPMDNSFFQHNNIGEINLSKQNKEAFMAHYLEQGWLYGAPMFTQASLNYFYQFKAEFPNSVYLPLLARREDEVSQHVAKSADNFKDVKFLKTSQYPTLEALLMEFSGEVIFIDLWATWCAPCIAEFKYNDALKSFTENKPITVLYISFDRPEDEKKWKELISKLRLQGTHIMASQALKEDIWNVVGDVGIMGAIPRYIIADTEGNIVVKDAPRPSSTDSLYQTMTEYLQ